MSYIVDFSITDLAGRKGVHAETLDRHVNVFFGLNGSGKTSLLKILHSAMSCDPRILRNVPFQAAEVRVYSVKYDRVFTYTISMEPAQPAKKVDQEAETSELFDSLAEYLYVSGELLARRTDPRGPGLPVWKQEPDIRDKGEGGWAHRYLPTSRLYLGQRTVESRLVRSSPAALSEDLLDQYYAQTVQALWRDYYHDVLTAISEAQEDGLASILEALLSRKRQRQETLHEVDLQTAYDRMTRFLQRQGSPGILGSFQSFEQRYRDDAQLRSVVSDINEIEKRIAEATTPRDKLQTLIQSMFTGNKTVYFRERSVDIVTDDEEEIGLSALSSGEKHILRILIETLLAQQNTILIDEPELSMHVDWQKELIETMRQLNPSAQIVMATHSPEIMAKLSDDKILRL